MLQGEGMVLEGGIKISHRRMPGISGLGKEAEVGEVQVLYHSHPGREFSFSSPLTEGSMPEQKNQNNDAAKSNARICSGFAHDFTS